MNTTNITIQSGGSCFLCSIHIVPTQPFHASGKLRVHSIQSLSEYLELDIGSVLSNGKVSIPLWLLDQMKRARLEVELCGDCVKLNQRLLELLGELEKNEVRMKSCLSLLQGNLFIARVNGTTDQGDDEVYDVKLGSSVGTRFKGKIGLLGALRWEALQKCSQKLAIIGAPKVMLERLSEKKLKEMTLKPKSNLLSETIPTYKKVSIPDDKDMDNCIVLSDDDVNDTEIDGDIDPSKAWEEQDLLYDTDNCVGLSKGFLNFLNYLEKDGDTMAIKDGDKDPFISGEEQDLDDKSEQRPSEDDYGSLSVDRSEDDDDYTPDNVFGSSTCHTGNKRAKIDTTDNQEETGEGSKLQKGGKYPKPIIIYGAKSGEHAEKSFKKWICIPETGKYKCRLCPKESNSAGINLHFKSAHLEMRYRCPDGKCGRLFFSRLGYDLHVETEHLEIRVECPLCKEKIRKGMLPWHRKRNAETGNCTLSMRRRNDNKIFSGGDTADPCDDDPISTPDNHLLGEGKGKNVAQLSLPVTTMSGEELKTDRPPNQRGTRRDKINRNVSQNHNEGSSKLQNDGKYSPPIIMYGSKFKSAELTGKSFQKSVFNPETGKYKCSLCPKESTSAGINLHFKSAHLRLLYKCPYGKCRRLFTSRRGYNLHAETDHLEIRIECPLCKEKIRKGMLPWHKRRNAENGSCPSIRLKK